MELTSTTDLPGIDFCQIRHCFRGLNELSILIEVFEIVTKLLSLRETFELMKRV